jgi:hypothetical protein
MNVNDTNNKNDVVIFIPNEIWCIILSYLEFNEDKENLELAQSMFREKEKTICDTFEYGIDVISKGVLKISDACNRIDKRINKIDKYNIIDTRTVHDIDDNIIDIRAQLNSLLFVALQLQESKRKYMLRGTLSVPNIGYEDDYDPNEFYVEL